jgi:hypothetical protein
MLKIGRESLAEHGGILGVQVDLIVGAVEGGSHRLLGRAVGQIVFQGYRYFLGYLYLPDIYWCLKRILARGLRRVGNARSGKAPGSSIVRSGTYSDHQPGWGRYAP